MLPCCNKVFILEIPICNSKHIRLKGLRSRRWTAPSEMQSVQQYFSWERSCSPRQTFHPPPPPLLQSHHGFNAQINPVHHNYMDVCLYWSHISQARLTVSGKIKIDVWLPGRSWGTSTALWLSSSWVYKLLSVILMDLFPSFSRSLPLFLHITLYWFTGVCQQMAPM